MMYPPGNFPSMPHMSPPRPFPVSKKAARWTIIGIAAYVLVSGLLTVAGTGAIIWVAWHFIAKFW